MSATRDLRKFGSIMEPSTENKHIFCYCHSNGGSDGEITVGMMVTSTTTFDDFIAQVQRKLELEAPPPKLKYVLEYDKSQMLALRGEEDLREMINFSEKHVHVYVIPGRTSTNIHHQETRDQVIDMTNRRNKDDVQELDLTAFRSYSDGQALADKIDLTTSCVDVEQHAVTSQLWKNAICGVGQTFTNAPSFRNALYRYCIAHKFSYKYLKNNNHILRVRCSVDGCPWRVNANQVGETAFLKITTYTDEHSHSAQDVIEAKPKARSKLAASIVSPKLRLQPDTTPNEIKATFATEFNMNISYSQSWHIREQAMRVVHGVPEESYRLIPWLCKRIMDVDEHALTSYEASSDHRFVKVFIAYGCSVLGFLSGCRPVIFIDGCHLSGPYKGTLLSATTVDADNQLFPLAYAIVGSERYDDWFWFLTKLKECIKFTEVVIVSDRHKNILSTVANVFGKENHAYCYRHIKENFSAEVSKFFPRSKTAKENALKLLDAVMYARLDLDYDKAVENLQNLKPELAEWVLKNEPEHWVMSKFPKRRWDHVTSNVAESFNAWMLKERRHYVFALMNEHRDKLASILLKAKENATLWKNSVGPNIERKLLENIVRGDMMIATPYGQHFVRVSTGFADLKVNMATRTCTCIGWQMSGIPCPHACAAIKSLKGNLYEYVEEWYKVQKQQLIYSNLMVPVETHDMPKERPDVAFTHDVENEEFLSPPTTKRPPGRPKTKRIESQFIKKRRLHCSHCNGVGHNKVTCKNPNPNS